MPLGREADTARLVERIVRYAERALPGLDPEPEAVRLCIQSLLLDSPDSFWTWERGPVIAVAGDNLFSSRRCWGRGSRRRR